MTLAHATLVAKVVEILQAAPALAGVPVYRNRLRSLDTRTTSAIVVRKEISTPAPGPGAVTLWKTEIRIECYARAASATDTAHERADALLVLAHAAVAADNTLEELAIDLGSPRLLWDEDDVDETLGAAIAQYPVLHRTPFESLEP